MGINKKLEKELDYPQRVSQMMNHLRLYLRDNGLKQHHLELKVEGDHLIVALHEEISLNHPTHLNEIEKMVEDFELGILFPEDEAV